MLPDPCRSGDARHEEQSSAQVHRRTRRHRTIFTEEQLDALEELFLQNQYPDVNTREKLAQSAHLREERVEVRSAGQCLVQCRVRDGSAAVHPHLKTQEHVKYCLIRLYCIGFSPA